MESFKSLNLLPSILHAVEALKFTTPTPIQAQAIPLALEGHDLIGCAQTGTGKTAAFGIPMLTRLAQHPSQTALILVPTRELAQQVEATLISLTRFNPEIRCVLLIGGVSMQPQLKSLRRNPRVIIATPGRLIDHLEHESVYLDHTSVLVLDEADRMLDMGFAPQLKRIQHFLPKKRQTLLFSATWAPEVDKLSRAYTQDPVKVTVGEINRAATKVTQVGIEVSQDAKKEIVLDEINRCEGSILIFTRTKSRTDRLAKYLNSYGLEVGRIHGDRSQAQRTAALESFKDGTIRILCATDIAARGIDVKHVAHVINFDLPNVPEDYIHRIGRTARAGASGNAISLISPDERAQWKDILKLLKKSGSEEPTVSRSEQKPGPVSTDAVRPRPAQPQQRPAQQQRRHQHPRQQQHKKQAQVNRRSHSQGDSRQEQSRKKHVHRNQHGGPNRKERRAHVQRPRNVGDGYILNATK